MDREYIAYLIFALIVAAVAGLIAFRRYRSPERTHRRRDKKENAAHNRRMGEREN